MEKLQENDEQGEALTRGIFERAISNVGRHMKSHAIWNLFIDFETSFLAMGKVNLLCY